MPAVIGPPSRLDAVIVGRSIHYPYADDVVFGEPVFWLTTGLYVLSVGGPPRLRPGEDLRDLVVTAMLDRPIGPI